MFGLSSGEIIVVALIVAIIFGWTWVPRIGENIGGLFSGVKKGMREDDERIVVKQVTPKSDKADKADKPAAKGDVTAKK